MSLKVIEYSHFFLVIFTVASLTGYHCQYPGAQEAESGSQTVFVLGAWIM